MKRSVLVSMLVAPARLALLVGGTSRGEPQTKEFVVAAWGDPHEAGWRKSLVPAFEKKYWVKVVWGQGFPTQDPGEAPRPERQPPDRGRDDGGRPAPPGGGARPRRPDRPLEALEREEPLRAGLRTQ